MRLFEYQAKRIFQEKGIHVPKSKLVHNLVEIPEDFLPAVYKAQILSGGRGKAGAVKFVEQVGEIKKTFDELIKIKIRSESVYAVLIEEKKTIVKEYYLSLVIDRQKKYPVFISSYEGGVDIEKVSRETPEKILKIPVDVLIGLQGFEIRRMAKFLEITDVQNFETITRAMYAIFEEENATLVEINPLADAGGELIALDAKIILDEKASFKHPKQFDEFFKEQLKMELENLSPVEKLAKQLDMTFVLLDGNIGIISDGAGTGMLTLDLVSDKGGKAANFCELGGLGDAERMNKGLQVVTSNPNVDVVLISLIGGITRMDYMAQGIADFLSIHQQTAPIVVRMCGTQEEEGRKILLEWDIPVDHDLNAVVSKAVEMARK